MFYVLEFIYHRISIGQCAQYCITVKRRISTYLRLADRYRIDLVSNVGYLLALYSKSYIRNNIRFNNIVSFLGLDRYVELKL